VVKAQNGEDALRLALELRPRLAVLDVMMPGLDGYEVTRRLRGDERTSEMPIILVTALAQASDVSRGLAAGADDYVRKPFDATDLKARIERLLS
jgi:DNA-binding response OmpR family regulator